MPATAQQWQQMRQKGRTDLLWLCKEVLGFKDVCEHVHRSMADNLQQFVGGTETVNLRQNGTWELVKGSYKPAISMWNLPLAMNTKVVDGKTYRVAAKPANAMGWRRTMTLFPRGHLKTTVADIAHSIQWIINYPDIRIKISTASGDLAAEIMRGMKQHFIVNETFRWLYPEFCPTTGKNGKVVEFGNLEEFTVPNKMDFTKKESTVAIVTVGSTVAGSRADVFKHDDMVDKENVRTKEGIATVQSHYEFLNPLIETSSVWPNTGWEDVIGTPYSHSDIYQYLLRKEKELTQADRKVLIVSAAANYPEGPALWPERVPMESLKRKEFEQGPEVFSSQYLMNPRPSSSGLVDSKDQIRWVPEKEIAELYARLRLHVTVDLAGMEPNARGKDNDYTVINLHGFGRDGSLYILELMHSRKVTPEEVINHLFSLVERHPRIFDIKVEKDAHARVLLPFMKREMERRNKWLPIVSLQRDNHTSKVQRIKGLQPWFRNGSVRFSKGINCQIALEDEILFFPKYDHDDILDTIADAMQNREGGVVSDVMPMEKRYQTESNRHPFEEESVDAQDLSWDLVTGARHESLVSGVDPITGW